MFTLRLKGLRLEPQRVRRAVDRAKGRVLGRSADLIRDTAQQSMPDREGLAPPGQPPRMESAWLKRSVRSAWDRSSQTSLAGPVRAGGAGAAEERMLMRVLEFGGQYVLGRRARRRRRIRGHRRAVVQVKAKPYMAPALKKERPRLPKLWAGSVQG